MTREFYYHIANTLWDLQPIVLAYAQATDALTQTTLGYDPGYYTEFMALDENGDGVIDDTESGKDGLWDFLCAIGAIYPTNLTEPDAFPLSTFQQGSRAIKYSDKAWNVDTSGGTGQSVDVTRIYVDAMSAFHTALKMANGEPGTDTFFNVPYGTGADGVSKWPSLQYARHVTTTGFVRLLYELAKSHAEKTGQGFTLFVPDAVPHFPSASYNPDGLANITEISDQQFLPNGNPNPNYDPDFAVKVFTAWFDLGEKWF